MRAEAPEASQASAEASGGRKLRILLESIKFEHTIFALPFAYLGVALAARAHHGWPGLAPLIWVTLAMAGARTVAMAVNRLADASMDALNPRTASRALPRRLLKPAEMAGFALLAGAVMVFSAAQLNPLCLALSPVAALFLLGYSYTKRFTWLCHIVLGLTDGIAKRFTWLCHIVLGLTDGIAPIGGWLAINPTISVANLVPPLLLGLAVAAWVGGFDLIYACQDIAFDRAHGLRSIPARFGPQRALEISEMMHGASVGLLAAVGGMLGLAWPFWIAVGVAAWLLIWEHRLVHPEDFSRLDLAFFNMNGYLAVSVFAFSLLAVILG